MALPIALQLYSVRSEMEKDFKGTLLKVKELGYDGVEFAGLFGHDAATVKNWCAEIGLTPISAHVPLQEMLDDLPGVLETYQEIGVEYIVVPYVPEDRRPGTDGWLPTIEAIKEIGKAAAEKGLILLYHNHDFEFTTVDGEYGLDMLYRMVPKEYLQTQLDTCWVNVGGERPDDYLRKYTDRIPVVHLKDFYRESADSDEPLYELIGIKSDAKKPAKKNFEFRPLGEGLQDLPLILTYSVFCGAKWVVVEQDEPSMGKTPMECAEMSIRYLKTVEAKRW